MSISFFFRCFIYTLLVSIMVYGGEFTKNRNFRMENRNCVFYFRFNFGIFHIRTLGKQDIYIFIVITMYFSYAISITTKYL